MLEQLFAEKVYTAGTVLENQLIHCFNGKITKIESTDPPSSIRRVENLSAGFIDIHINGGEQFYFTQYPIVDTVKDIDQSFNTLGTAYTLPTLVTSSLENILQGIEAVKIYMASHPQSGVLGMHLEGPFLNPVKRGAHMAKYVRRPTDTELAEIISHGRDIIKIITIAPEMFEREQIEMLLDSGITVSAGHSNATYQEASASFAQGIKLCTHLYNAMSPLQHRKPGLVGAVFNTDSVYAPIIPDGLHCDFEAAEIAYKIKKDKLFLISDALFIGGKVTEFKWQEFDAKLINGEYINSNGNLAGSAISLADAVRNVVNKLNIPLNEAIDMVTYRPACAIEHEHLIGSVAVGYPAVFTVFDNALSTFEVAK
ncbi:MAG: N-acetylglucosamine-6-phosphate deacetylase [Mucilaginibacter sp.]